MICAAISAATPDCGQPSSTTTQRPVFLTEATTVVDVHRAERAQVDHLGIDALLGEFLGRLERVGHADRPGDDRDVLAGPGDARLADRQHEVVELRAPARLAVEDLVLEEDHRVGIADRGLEQPLGVGRGVGRDDFQAGTCEYQAE